MEDFNKIFLWRLTLAVPVAVASVILPLYLQELGFSYVQMGLIFGIGPILGLVINYFAGSHSDLIGRKRYIVLASIFAMMYFLILAFSLELWQFALGILFWSVYGAVGRVSSTTYLSDILPKERRGHLMGLYGGITGIISSLGIFATGILIIFLGYKNIFFVCALLAILAALLSLTLREARKIVSYDKLNYVHLIDFRKIPPKIRFIFLIALAFFISSETLVLFAYPLYFKSFGLDPYTIGILMGVLSLVWFSSQTIFGRMSDTINPCRIFAYSFLLLIPLNLALIFAQSIIISSLILISQGVLLGLVASSFDKIQLESVGDNSGRELAFIMNSIFIARVIGPLLGGVILGYFSFSGLFAIRAFVFLAGAVLMFIFIKRFDK